jgi:hypothetical protein
VKECAGILELPQRQDAELEGIAIFEGNLLPTFVMEIRIISREPAQRLPSPVPRDLSSVNYFFGSCCLS